MDEERKQLQEKTPAARSRGAGKLRERKARTRAADRTRGNPGERLP